MNPNKYFDVLELNQQMSRAEILCQAPLNYRRLSKSLHPDNNKTGNSEKFIELKTAYDALMNIGKYYELVGKTGRTTEPTKLITEVWNSIWKEEFLFKVINLESEAEGIDPANVEKVLNDMTSDGYQFVQMCFTNGSWMGGCGDNYLTVQAYLIFKKWFK